MIPRHAVLIHPSLSFSGITERLIATARVLRGQEIPVTVVTTSGSRSFAVEQAGFDVSYAELPESPRESPFAFWRTKQLIRRLQPTLLHVTDESMATFGAAIASALRVPYVLEVHQQVHGRLPHAPGFLAGVIATSESLVEGIVNHGRIARGAVRVVRHAPVPVEHADPQVMNHEPPFRIGCAGYLDHRHNTEWFLEAARSLIRTDANATFVILGEGPRELSLRRAIREASLTEHVTIGVPTTAQCGQTLASLDVYVSCRTQGGPSWISCQALAQGVPCIFAAAGEAFHLVRDRRTGVLVEPGDGRRLFEEIQLMLQNPDFARSLGAKGREHFLSIAPHARFERDVAGAHALATGAAMNVL